MAVLEHVASAENIIVDDDHDTDFLDEDELKDDFDELKAESLWERLAALVDMVPPTTRASLAGLLSRARRSLADCGRQGGQAAWILVTGAIIVAVPVALEVEREHFVIQQEAAHQTQQQQAKLAVEA